MALKRRNGLKANNMQGETMKKEYDFYKGDEKGDDWIVLTLKLPQPAPVTLSISPKWPSSEWFEK